MNQEKTSRLINNLKLRNIEAFYIESFEEAKLQILEMIGINSTVGIGNSATLKRMKLTNTLLNRGNIVFDKTIATTKEESKDLKRKSLLADYYVSSTNAISMEGHIVNVDHSGNRVAAMIYGPEKVIIVVGKNKIVETLDDAIYRVKNIASPKNAVRAGFNPPCVELNKCVDCRSKERVCNSLVIIEGQYEPDRMKVIIVNEEEGF